MGKALELHGDGVDFCAGSRGRAFRCAVAGAGTAQCVQRPGGHRSGSNGRRPHRGCGQCDGTLRRAEAAAGDSRKRRRRYRHRRFRAQSRQDRCHAGDASRPARPAADHVPAARLWPASEDGRGACGQPGGGMGPATGSTFRTQFTRAGRSRRSAAATGSPSKFKCLASRRNISPTAPPSAMR